jgi:hypothetical protein
MFSELPSPHTELKHGGRFCPIDHDYPEVEAFRLREGRELVAVHGITL